MFEGSARPLAVASALLALVLAVACGSGDSGGKSGQTGGSAEAPSAAAAPQPAPEPATDDAAEAKVLFETRCATCHGARGAGDGPGSASLDPKPRNFQDTSWQESVSDEQIANTVLYGGAAVGKSPAMPGNPDLIAKEQLVAALVNHIRSLGR